MVDVDRTLTGDVELTSVTTALMPPGHSPADASIGTASDCDDDHDVTVELDDAHRGARRTPSGTPPSAESEERMIRTVYDFTGNSAWVAIATAVIGLILFLFVLVQDVRTST